jgi:Tol biopolymer transport system component
MKLNILFLLALCSMVLFTGCSSSDPVSPNATTFKGFIYYSNGGEIYRLQLSDQKRTMLFSNAVHPDMLNNGQILAVERGNPYRLMLSDLTGANRNTLVLQNFNGPKHVQYMNKPRISYDQQHVVYEGDNIHNPNTYVVDATDGSLVATIGDYSKSQPMISPSWAPDGSIVVAGWTSMNNGIYKVASDFSSIERIDPNLSNVSDPSVSPDGKYVAFCRDGQVWTMGLDGSNPTQLYVANGKYLRMPTWSPDSKYIAAVNTLASSGKVHIFDVQAKTVTELTGFHYVDSGNQLCWRY